MKSEYSFNEKVNTNTTSSLYIPIKDVQKAKGLKSTRSIRMEINKPESKYISRKVKVNGGTSYEVLFSTLDPELQQKIRACETKSTALVPLNYQAPILSKDMIKISYRVILHLKDSQNILKRIIMLTGC